MFEQLPDYSAPLSDQAPSYLYTAQGGVQASNYPAQPTTMYPASGAQPAAYFRQEQPSAHRSGGYPAARPGVPNQMSVADVALMVSSCFAASIPPRGRCMNPLPSGGAQPEKSFGIAYAADCYSSPRE